MPANANSRAVGSITTESARADVRLRAILTSIGLLAIGLAVVVLARAGVAIVPAGARLAGVAVPVAFALYRLAREPADRFAVLLLAAASAFSLTTLAELHSSPAYSVGRLSVWLIEPMLILLVLSFPSGRLTTAAQRRLVAAAGLLVAALYVPTAFLAPFPAPSPWTTCGTGCPANAFQLGDGATAFTQDVLQPTRELVTVALFALVAVE